MPSFWPMNPDDELRPEVESLAAPTATATVIAAGSQLGPYRIESLIGAGGMGQVFRAVDTRLGRKVAIKIASEQFGSRFGKEARAISALNHPYICTLHDVGPNYLVMELVEGETLDAYLKRQALSLHLVLRYGGQIAGAIAAAHAKGITHRDLKPANIMVTSNGVKVLDFGLARFTPGGPLHQNDLSTATQAIAGTLAYMAPEQLEGKDCDARTDIFALGLVLYEMATRKRVFQAESQAALIVQVMRCEPDLAQLGPPQFAHVVERCVRKDPNDRWQSARDVQAELEWAGKNGAIPAAVERRKRSALLPLSIAAGALFAVAILYTTLLRRPPQPNPRFTRMTWDTGLSTEPALSRDGSLLAYASDRQGGGNHDLWVQRVNGGEPIRLTTDPTDDREPDFSPDGSLIVFRADRNGGGICVIPSLGGDARQIAERGRDPKFSPDGRQVAYWVGNWLGGPRVIAPSSIFVVSSMGGVPHRVAEGLLNARNPVWSRDGKALLFWGRNTVEEDFDWWYAPLSGGAPVRSGALSVFKDHGLSGDPLPRAWTGAGVLFAAKFGQAVTLWQLAVSQRSGKVNGPLVRLNAGAGIAQFPSADAAGTIAFQDQTLTLSIFTLPLDPNTGKVLGTMERHVNSFSDLAAGRGSISDDGRVLAFPKHRTGASEIWVKGLQTGTERHLATTSPGELNPVVSRDGSQIGYTTGYYTAGFGSQDGYVIAARGGSAKNICTGCTVYGWLNDNRRVIVLRGSGGSAGGDGVDIIDPVTGATQVALTGRGLARPTLSWDNRWHSKPPHLERSVPSRFASGQDCLDFRKDSIRNGSRPPCGMVA